MRHTRIRPLVIVGLAYCTTLDKHAMTRRSHRHRLSNVLSIVLGLVTTGCCINAPTVENEEVYDGIVADDVLVEIRAGNPTDDERCDAACTEIVERQEGVVDEVLSCSAMVEDSDLPWDPSHTQVEITCIVQYTAQGFCTGRRPQGHRELLAEVDGVGPWFAMHAHLERASVAAFAELATWLEGRGAPSDLVERCRAAASDEIVHADLMAAFARRGGAEVPMCEAETAPDDVLTVAIHNAVEGCVHESFAAIVAAHQARHAAVELGRDAFAQIAGDELRHGELAWELHAWLLDQLDADGRALVERAQAEALMRLPERAAANAHATPAGLGWPAPARASEMARRFATLMAA